MSSSCSHSPYSGRPECLPVFQICSRIIWLPPGVWRWSTTTASAPTSLTSFLLHLHRTAIFKPFCSGLFFQTQAIGCSAPRMISTHQRLYIISILLYSFMFHTTTQTLVRNVKTKPLMSRATKTSKENTLLLKDQKSRLGEM